MSSTLTRGITLAYGSYTIGGSADAELHGAVAMSWDYTTFTVSCTAVVFGTSDSTFVTNCQAIETAFRTPRQTLTLSIGSSTWRTFAPSSNTGFDAAPKIAQDLSQQSSTRVRYYQVSVTVGLPADLSGENALGWMTTTIETLPNDARVLSATGFYTASGANGAYTQCTTYIYTLIEAALTTLTGTWERTVNRISYERTDKRATFEIVYTELFYAQSSVATDDTDLKLATLDFRLSKPGYEIGANAVDRPRTFVLTYTAWVAKATDADTKWTETLRAWVYEKLATFTGAALNVVDDESFGVERMTNRITAVLTGRSYAGQGQLLAYTASVEFQRDWGWRTAPLWSGEPFDRDVIPGPQRLLRIRKQRFVTRGLDASRRATRMTLEGEAARASLPMKIYTLANMDASLAADPETPASGGKGGWLQLSAVSSVRPFLIGQDSSTTGFIEYTETIVDEWTSISKTVPVSGGRGTGSVERSIRDVESYGKTLAESEGWGM